MLIEVPGRAFELRSGAEPSRSVSLPLEARPRPGMHWGYGAFFLILGALGGILILSLAAVAKPGLGQIVIAIALGGGMLVWGAATGLTLLWDALRGAGLSIDAEGFSDRRLGVRVAWCEVRSAEYRYARLGIAGLALQIEGHRLRPQNPFRVGYDRRGRDEFMVPMKFLTPEARTLAFVFETLIERAGGRVMGKPALRQ